MSNHTCAAPPWLRCRPHPQGRAGGQVPLNKPGTPGPPLTAERAQGRAAAAAFAAARWPAAPAAAAGSGRGCGAAARRTGTPLRCSCAARLLTPHPTVLVTSALPHAHTFFGCACTHRSLLTLTPPFLTMRYQALPHALANPLHSCNSARERCSGLRRSLPVTPSQLPCVHSLCLNGKARPSTPPPAFACTAHLPAVHSCTLVAAHSGGAAACAQVAPPSPAHRLALVAARPAWAAQVGVVFTPGL